ncbi:unnamed protein product [Linum tenue]|uniref:Succinate dehydrogenase subunit 5, mitochondrial n=1 Tax=Linum tenue TaxID=586396 RepID=A0AAV0RLD4_9ROSI|nr:unnamed protein product [Linum tenue]
MLSRTKKGRKMGKMVALRSLYRAASRRSSISFAAIAGNHHQSAPRSLFTLTPATASADRIPSAHLPEIKDHDVLCAFKDLMAASWDEIDATVVHDVKNALSKNSDDKSGQEILKNVFRSCEAVEEFGGMIMTLKMELDDSIGMSGEPLTDDYAKAIRMFFERYSSYLESFGPDEAYLRKKVEMELGSKMIFLKMRCAGLGSEWGKVTLIGTSGLAGSYVEQRA